MTIIIRLTKSEGKYMYISLRKGYSTHASPVGETLSSFAYNFCFWRLCWYLVCICGWNRLQTTVALRYLLYISLKPLLHYAICCTYRSNHCCTTLFAVHIAQTTVALRYLLYISLKPLLH